jgi:geranylgeranyl pyrophosphate synthase
MRRYETLPEARQVVRTYVNEAVRCLDEFPASAARDSLLSLPAYVLSRVE